MIIIASNQRANMNQMVFDIIIFNLDNHADRNYRTEGTAVDAGYLLITTGPFENAGEATAWLKNFNYTSVIREAASADLKLFVISRDNLQKFRKDKNIDRYAIFHSREYPNRR